MKKILYILALFSSFSYSQGYFFNSFSEKDGLSSDNVYKVIQDKKGYLWFATDFGVSRYDGSSFKNFSTNEGITDNEVLSIFEDSKGRLWFETFNGKPCFYLNGKIHNPQNHRLLEKISFNRYINKTYEDSKGNIWVSSLNKVYKIDFEKNKVLKFKNKALFFYENSKGEILFYSGQDYFINSRSGIKEFINQKTSFRFALNTKAYVKLENKGIVYGNDNWLNYKEPNSNSIRPININSFLNESANIISVYENNGLYVTTNDGVLFLKKYLSNKTITKTDHFLKGINTTSVLLDHQKNLWFTTTNGVYQIPSERNKKINSIEENVISLNKNNKTLVFASNNNKSHLIDLKSFKHIKEFDIDVKPKKIIKSDNLFYVISNNGVHKITGLKSQKIFALFSLKDMVVKGNFYYLADASGVYKVPKYYENKKTFRLGDFPKHKNVNRVIASRPFMMSEYESILFASTADGIFKIGKTKVDKFLPSNNAYKHRVVSIDKIDKFWVLGTDGNGLYIYSQDSLLKNYTEKSGLFSNQVRNTFSYKDTLYIVTKKGVQKLDNKLNITSVDHLSFKKLSLNWGMALRDSIFIATSSGIIYSGFNKNPTKKNLLSEIKAKNKSTVFTNGSVLDYTKDPFVFNFKLFNYSTTSYNLSYRLLPTNESWEKPNVNAVSFQNLSPGSYTFQIGIDQSVINSLSFTIKTPYWQSNWFVFLIVVIVSIFVFFVNKTILSNKLKKAKKEHDFNLMIAKAEHDALKAQMNPHFIFNSLNAIQNLVLKNKTNEAFQYLGSFSKLVRSILNNSRSLSITISKEIEFLELYLKLESLRFSNKFNSKISFDSKLNVHLSIPSMIIQPFVENSIIHGLLNLEERISPRLVIHFYDDNDFLYCLVEDNGTGYHQSEVKKSSLGLKIIKDRLNLYDSSGKSSYTIESGANGTKVVLKINKDVKRYNY